MRKTTVVDLNGRTFGKLTVIYRNGSTKNGKALWRCKCECGNEHDAISSLLIDGRTKSCGCLFKFNVGIAAMNCVYADYKKQAFNRNLSFELKIENFYNLTQQNCHYCGVEPKQFKNHKYTNGHYIYNGIDRKNNSIGYELLNCVSCCKKCNFAKGSMSYNEFIDYIKKLTSHKVWEK